MVSTPGWRAQREPGFKRNPHQPGVLPMKRIRSIASRSAHFRRDRPHERRGPAGRPARARRAWVAIRCRSSRRSPCRTPPGVESFLAHRPGLGRRPGALHPRGHAGRGLQDAACSDPPRSSRWWPRWSPTIPDVPLVLDPVFASGRGDEFAGEDMVSAIRELLVPQSTVVTPNIPELRRLARPRTTTMPSLAECAQRPARQLVASTCS